MRIPLRYYAILLMILLLVAVVATGSDDDGDIIGGDGGAGGAGGDGGAGGAGGSSLSDANAVANAVGGNSSVESRSLALAQSLGDVDLGRMADCVVTEQYGIVVVWQRQNWEYDPWCIAEKLDIQGKYVEAAMMRCFHKPTAKLYGDSCIETLTFNPSVFAPTVSATANQPVEVVVEDCCDDDEEDVHEAHESDYAALLERVSKIEAEKAANVRRYNRDQVEVQKKHEEDQEFAQQALEDLSEYRK